MNIGSLVSCNMFSWLKAKFALFELLKLHLAPEEFSSQSERAIGAPQLNSAMYLMV